MSTFNSLREAAAYAGVSHITMREWCERHAIGTLVAGRWTIDRAALDRILAARQVLKPAAA